MEITIERYSNPHTERQVRLVADVLGRRNIIMTVDPQEEIAKAIQLQLNRYHCVISMGMGLMNAGYTVYLDYGPQWLRGRGKRLFYTPYYGYPVYHLLGLAIGQGEWERFVASLKRYVQPAQRFGVLEHTARYYWDNHHRREVVRPMFP